MKKVVKRITFNTKNVVTLDNKQMAQVKGGMKRFEELKDLYSAKGLDFTDEEFMPIYEQYLTTVMKG
jgi:hypothetical protein